jgi:hypothetical protein
MRRSGDWHLAQTISNPKVLWRSSAHGMYFDLRAGFSGFSVAVVSVGAWGTIWLRSRACDESTPQ